MTIALNHTIVPARPSFFCAPCAEARRNAYRDSNRDSRLSLGLGFH
jgi:hypothetical protein